MKVTFVNGETKNCNQPTEQKLFKQGEQYGWLLSIIINETMSSEEADNFFTEGNINKLVLSSDDGENGCCITGYNAVTSMIIRHAESNGTIELQLRKITENKVTS